MVSLHGENLLDHEQRGVTDHITAYNLSIHPPLGLFA